MSTSVRADEAARILGVSRATLYAYVSRGLVGRRTAVDGRTSLYDRDELERIASSSSRRRPAERPTIDVRISSAVTELHDDRLLYRGHDAVRLASESTFEQVAELLWSGVLPPDQPTWPCHDDDLARCRPVVRSMPRADATTVLAVAVALCDNGRGETGADAARRFLAFAPTLLGAPDEGDIAERLGALLGHLGSREVSEAIRTALILLADHELATSTLAVRVAASVRAEPYSALATGLHVLRAPLHGAASPAVADLFVDAQRDGARAAVTERLGRREHLPGFGHKVYRTGDPRLPPLLATIERLPAADERYEVVDDVLREAALRIGHQPNIDFGLGALLFVADLPDDPPIFAFARMAGWAAHYDEELTERPVRYRGLARHGA